MKQVIEIIDAIKALKISGVCVCVNNTQPESDFEEYDDGWNTETAVGWILKILKSKLWNWWCQEQWRMSAEWEMRKKKKKNPTPTDF